MACIQRTELALRAHLLKIWIETRSSYWFVPSIMACLAILFSVATTAIDAGIDTDWPEKIPFVYSNQPDGARALLATVAGSMITVTGITFSLTLLAVSHATSQFGPRLLTNFMRDRGNQITLGTFIATFLYCLMVLRTVQNAESRTGTTDAANEPLNAFVPHLSILVAILLTIASVGVLIYFIHHIPESIRLSKVVAEVGRELLKAVPTLFPEAIAEEQPDSLERDPRLDLPDHFAELAARVASNGDGYIQAIDSEGLLHLAKQHDLVLQICARPGNFVSKGQPLLLVSPNDKLTDELESNLEFSFARGSHRTSNQNSLFLVDQLVEVTARALSPGVNDPMTAMTCMDWLQSVLIQVTNRGNPESCRFDESGTLRIVAEAITFCDFCQAVFAQLRPYVASDRNAAFHMVKMIANVVRSSSRPQHIELLDMYATKLIEAAEAQGLPADDLRQLHELYANS